METEDIAIVKKTYCQELARLSRDELLNRQIAFEDIPATRHIDWEVRLHQAICLGHTLVKQFGVSGWQRPLEMRRRDLAVHHPA